MKTRLDLGFYKWQCRAMFGDNYPKFVCGMLEYSDDTYYYIEAEDLEGRVAKAKFRFEMSQTSTFLMMYDAFYGDYIKSERIA